MAQMAHLEVASFFLQQGHAVRRPGAASLILRAAYQAYPLPASAHWEDQGNNLTIEVTMVFH